MIRYLFLISPDLVSSSELDMVATSLQRQVDMSAKLTRVYDQRAGGTLTAEGPSGVVQPLPAQVQVYWARLHLAEIIRCVLSLICESVW